MRKFIVIWVALASLVVFEANADVAVNLDRKTLDLLGKSISRHQSKAINEMPGNVRSYLSSIINPKKIYDLEDEDSMLWIHTHIINGRDQNLKESIDRMMASLALSGDRIHGDDVSSILEDHFFALWNKEEFDLEDSIRGYAEHWRERSKPSVRLSPDGLNPIEWIWELEVESRKHGVLHVGIDTKKRTFICYEYPLGLYFPEGEIMERIYREIVQDQDMAQHHIGVGRRKTDPPTK
jgi:hypothetical protein